MTELQAQIQKTGYTIIGRLGCYFYEGAINICKQAILRGRLVQYKLISLHETAYENEINRLKGYLPQSDVQHHEIKESPCVFYNEQYVGSLDEFTIHLRTHYGVSSQQAINELIPAADQRKERAINSSPLTYVRMGLAFEKEQFNTAHQVLIEIDSERLPRSCQRFIELGKGKNGDAEQPGYIGSELVRVQKDSFLQFGDVQGAEEKYGVLDDEAYVIPHDQPSLIGFVGYYNR